MARRNSPQLTGSSSLILWGSPNFELRRRSFPHESTRLEILATRCGLEDERLRELLHAEVERRRAEQSEQA